jgi:hypothetical protein
VWYSVTLSPTDDEGDLLAAYFETMKSNKDLQSVYADIGIGSAMSSDKAYRTVVFFLAKPQITSSSQPTSTTSTAQPYSSSKPNDNKKCHEINNRYNVLMSSLRFTKPSSSSYFNAMGTSDSYYEKYSYNIAATEYNAILDSYKSQYESEIRSVDCSSALILSPFNYSDSVTIFN